MARGRVTEKRGLDEFHSATGISFDGTQYDDDEADGGGGGLTLVLGHGRVRGDEDSGNSVVESCVLGEYGKARQQN